MGRFLHSRLNGMPFSAICFNYTAKIAISDSTKIFPHIYSLAHASITISPCTAPFETNIFTGNEIAANFLRIRRSFPWFFQFLRSFCKAPNLIWKIVVWPSTVFPRAVEKVTCSSPSRSHKTLTRLGMPDIRQIKKNQLITFICQPFCLRRFHNISCPTRSTISRHPTGVITPL